MIAVNMMSGKGGTGKTTATTTLGADAARSGLRVLIIDADQQADSNLYAGVPYGSNLFEVLVNDAPLLHRDPVRSNIVRVDPSFWQTEDVADSHGQMFILPGEGSTARIDARLDRLGRDPGFFRQKLTEVARVFDLVLIDNSPSVSRLMVQMMVASDYVLIPTRCEYLSANNIVKVYDAAGSVHVPVLGIVPMMYDRRAASQRETLAELHATYPGEVWQPIRYNDVWPQSTRAAMSVFCASRRTRVALADATAFGQRFRTALDLEVSHA